MKFVWLGLSVLALSGCATLIEGSSQSIAVTTPPTDGAKCVLTSTEGTYFVTTPGNVQVHKTKNDIQAECDHDGFAHASQTIAPHFNGATLGNVIAGGGIGIVVDAASGADFNYPDSVAITMNPLVAPLVAPSARNDKTATPEGTAAAAVPVAKSGT